MGLRDTVEKDVRAILTDEVYGAGIEMQFYPPGATVPVDVVGYSNDISQMIDPDTGQAVSGRSVTVSVPIRPFYDANVGLPKNIPDKKSTPWVIEFQDVFGSRQVVKVAQADPDRILGFVTCTLERYSR